MKQLPHNAFSMEYPTIVSRIITPIEVDESCMTRQRDANFITVDGFWDTGANCSVIQPEVAKKLNLIPFGKTKVSGVNSHSDADVYLVDLILPDNMQILNVGVVASTFMGGDILIGMDIIQKGDFCISNGKGNTTFSYCRPSHEEKTCLLKKTRDLINKNN